jgi:hypothetical protein
MLLTTAARHLKHPAIPRHLLHQRRTLLGLVHAIDKRVYRWAQSVLPPISKTENIALGCGTIGFDRDIFSGSPSLRHLIDTYQPRLSEEEERFLEVQVHTLCTLLNDHEVVTKKDFSKEAWDYMRDEKFFGMKVRRARKRAVCPILQF